MDSTVKSASFWQEYRTDILAVAAAVILLACLWEHLLQHLALIRAFWTVPGPLAYPIIGNAHMFSGGSRDFFEFLRKCGREYGPIFRVWIGPRPLLVLCGAETVQPLLNSSVHIEKSEEYKSLDTWLGTGLLTSGGEKWHKRRKLLTGAFHTKLLESYIDSLNKIGNILVTKLNSIISKMNPNELSEGIDVIPIVKLCSLDSICETIMGFKLNALEGGSNTEYINTIHRIAAIVQLRAIYPWLRPDILFNLSSYGKEFKNCVDIIHNFTYEVIRQRKEEHRLAAAKGTAVNENSPQRKSFLDLLLDLSCNGQVLSDEDIREEVDTFMFAGHDTTAIAITWSLFVLGNHPEIQERILEEKRNIFDEDSHAIMKLNQLAKLEYLDFFVKEVLRMFPSVPHIGRELTSPFTIEGHTFPSGTNIMVSMFILHRSLTYFPNPEKFKPERFLATETIDKHPFAYTPFSAGSRNCIGQKFAILEIKLIVLKILENFEVKSIKRMEEIVLQGELVLNSPDGVHISFKKREVT